MIKHETILAIVFGGGSDFRMSPVDVRHPPSLHAVLESARMGQRHGRCETDRCKSAVAIVVARLHAELVVRVGRQVADCGGSAGRGRFVGPGRIARFLELEGVSRDGIGRLWRRPRQGSRLLGGAAQGEAVRLGPAISHEGEVVEIQRAAACIFNRYESRSRREGVFIK